jgi:fibrillarin-like rRNA methylase
MTIAYVIKKHDDDGEIFGVYSNIKSVLEALTKYFNLPVTPYSEKIRWNDEDYREWNENFMKIAGMTDEQFLFVECVYMTGGYGSLVVYAFEMDKL